MNFGEMNDHQKLALLNNIRYTPCPHLKPEFRHAYIAPLASYAPWLNDSDFLKIFEKARKNTLVDTYRCYELWHLLGQTRHLEGDIIEIGVYKGGTAKLLVEKAALEGINATVYLCDTFEGVVKSSDKDTFYKGGEHSDTSTGLVEQLLDFEGNYQILKGIFPDDTADMIPKVSKFRFCHIDVDTYQSSKDVTEWIWDKMVLGGMIVYDDYGFRGCEGVTEYVNEVDYKDCIKIHNLNGHAILIKL